MNKVKVRKWILRYLIIFVAVNALMFPIYGNMFNDNRVVVASGVVTSKIVIDGRPNLIVNKKAVVVDNSSYAETKVGSNVTLTREEKTALQELILIISFLCCLSLGVSTLLVILSSIFWLFDDDTQQTYLQYIKW